MDPSAWGSSAFRFRQRRVGSLQSGKGLRTALAFLVVLINVKDEKARNGAGRYAYQSARPHTPPRGNDLWIDRSVFEPVFGKRPLVPWRTGKNRELVHIAKGSGGTILVGGIHAAPPSAKAQKSQAQVAAMLSSLKEQKLRRRRTPGIWRK
jgi:hypothetical protein